MLSYAELPTIPFFLPELLRFFLQITVLRFFFIIVFFFFFFLHTARQTTALKWWFDHKFNRTLILKHTWREKYSQTEWNADNTRINHTQNTCLYGRNSMINEHFYIGSVSRVVESFVFMNSFFFAWNSFFCHHDSFFWSHKVGSSTYDDGVMSLPRISRLWVHFGVTPTDCGTESRLGPTSNHTKGRTLMEAASVWLFKKVDVTH